MARGRPPITRARVLNYWDKHGPCSIMQICRQTGADRRHVQRIMRAAEKYGQVSLPVNWGKANQSSGSDFKRCARNAKRRAERYGWVGNNFTSYDALNILEIQKGNCAICAKSLNGNWHIDHIVPLKHGGGNEKSNIQVTCPECNIEKGCSASVILPHYAHT